MTSDQLQQETQRVANRLAEAAEALEILADEGNAGKLDLLLAQLCPAVLRVEQVLDVACGRE